MAYGGILIFLEGSIILQAVQPFKKSTATNATTQATVFTVYLIIVQDIPPVLD
jgi:hypothetical protein